MSSPEWKVRDNGPIHKLEHNLWEVESLLPTVPMRRRMTLIRLGDGSVVVHSAICLAEEQQQAIDDWGPVRFIVVPNALGSTGAPGLVRVTPGHGSRVEGESEALALLRTVAAGF